MMTPSRSRPAGVSAGTRSGRHGDTLHDALALQVLEALLSSDREIPAAPVDLVEATTAQHRSRTISGVHRSAKTELANATGQYWA